MAYAMAAQLSLPFQAVQGYGQIQLGVLLHSQYILSGNTLYLVLKTANETEAGACLWYVNRSHPDMGYRGWGLCETNAGHYRCWPAYRRSVFCQWETELVRVSRRSQFP